MSQVRVQAAQGLYNASIAKLIEALGDKNFKAVEKYLHYYDGASTSVKPVAKHVTVFWVGRADDRLIIRTEGADDIVLSKVGDEAVPTIIFRKLKAVYLREFMQLLRNQWERYGSDIKSVVGQDYDFLKCSLSPGIVGETKGVMHGRCMRCPADVLMGATSANVGYNLASRFVGDSAYALTPTFRRMTGNAVDEIAYTTIMMGEGQRAGEERTGALFSETLVEPGTLFVGKTVLFMPSPVELLYALWLLSRVIRVGARTSIWGTFKVEAVAMVADLFEVGTAYEIAEKLAGSKDLAKTRQGILDHLKNYKYAAGATLIEVDYSIAEKIRSIDVLDKALVLELWRSASNYVKAVGEYIGVGSSKQQLTKQ